MIENTQAMQKLNYQPESVAGKAVLITGGTTGIGRATAILLASQGARIFTFGRNRSDLEAALDEIRDFGDEVYGVTADTSNPDDIRGVYALVDDQFDRLDILINNAALGAESIASTGYEEMEYIIRVNLLGYMTFIHEAVQRMQRNGGGHIVNIGSMSADVREKGSSVYVATKAAIQGMSGALRKEVSEMGIRVSLIEPGAVGTDMQPETPEEERQQQREMKMMRAEDIAYSVLYCLTQPKHVDVVQLQVRPAMQII